MGQTLLIDLYYLTPELILFLGAMFLLMWGVFSSNTSSMYKKNLSLISKGVIVLSIYTMCESDHEGKLFGELILNNAFTEFVKILILLSGLGVSMMMWPSKENKTYAFELHVLMLLSMGGMMIMVSANSLISLFIGMEIMSLPLYIMAASDRDKSISTEAGIKYFILGSLSTGIFLFGSALVYGFTGTLDFTQIDVYFTSVSDGSSSIPLGFLVGLIFIIISFCFKISAAPFHMWTPDVYQGSPTVITAFFSSAPKIAGIAIFLRLLLEPFYNLADQWQQIIIFVSAASMLVGSLGAIMQNNFKRLLAYSSIGHIGFALVGLASTEDEGLVGIIIYMVIYLTMTLSAFACLLMVKRDGHNCEEIKDLSGISRTHPTLALILAIIMLSMAGIPPLAGFFAKFYILIPAIKKEMYTLAILAIMASLISAYYYLKIVKVMYFDESQKKNDAINSPALITVALAGAAFNVFYIVAPTPLINMVSKAAAVLFN